MRITALALLLGFMALVSCSDASPRDAGRVAVDIAPVRGLIAPVLREGVGVSTLVPDAASPHGFEMRPSDVEALRSAGLIVHVGAGLSPEIDRAVAALSRGASLVVMGDALGIEGGHHHHHHGDGEVCDHGDTDPHLWLDPALVRSFYESIPQDVVDAWMDRDALAAALSRVDAVEARILAMRPDLEGSRIVTQHHAFGRLCERLGIEVVDTVRDGAHLDPSPAGVAAFASALRETDVAMVFLEPQFPSALSERLAQSSGVRVGVLDPLGSGDWFAMMNRILDTLELIGDAGSDG